MMQKSCYGIRDSPKFPFGSITVNCHAFGVTGKAHPRAAQQQKQQNDEDNTEQNDVR